MSWSLLARLLDGVQALGGLLVGLLMLAAVALVAGLAFRLQRAWVACLAAAPDRPIGIGRLLRMELLHSPLGLPIMPFWLLFRGGRALFGKVSRLREKLKGKTEEEPPPPPAEAPFVAATLGPSFLLAGLFCVALYAVTRLVEPFLTAWLGLMSGASSWQYLLLGRRPELVSYLPWTSAPFVGGLLVSLLWLGLWAGVASSVRLWQRSALATNLVKRQEEPEVLPLWRRWAGANDLMVPAPSYRRWASWMVAVAAVLLPWAWFSLAGNPYRVQPGEFAVALVVWISWALHLLLRGAARLPAVDASAASAQPVVEAAGWLAVLADLKEHEQIARPLAFESSTLEPLGRSRTDPRTEAVLSPLVLELLPEPRLLTPMQRMVLTVIALQGYVHLDPPVTLEELKLGEGAHEAREDKSGQRSRHQIVLAPEGSGKTTLALLAAANHALVHTQATLVLLRDGRSAEQAVARFRRAIDPSTLRWNVRVRHPGSDLMNDLSQGIVPDVIVTSLHDLVVTLLDRTFTFGPFLRNLGLIVVDDVESYLGTVEVHAQLALRRLLLTVRQVRETRGPSADSAGMPQLLMLGSDSMHETAKWANSLCGVDAVVRTFAGSTSDEASREKAELLAGGRADEEPVKEPVSRSGLLDSAKETSGGRRQYVYRLRDFRRASGDRIGIQEVVDACERRAVPWHYRLCGDGRRDLGRGPLWLRQEPRFYCESPEDACVVFLAGTWSEIRRERRRLVQAGSRFSRFRSADGGAAAGGESGEPIALITDGDPDLEMALTQLDKRFSLAGELDTLPRPVIRPPSGRVVESHLSADLVQRWTEVEDLLEVFGTALAPRLRWLAGQGLLLCEPRNDVDDSADRYVERVYVRALVRAVRAEGDGQDDALDGGSWLSPKVGQIELTGASRIAVRDRTSLGALALMEPESAPFLYYPGRIFGDARGTFVVVGRVSEEAAAGAEGELQAGDVLAEPFLAEEISSPRWRLTIRRKRSEPRTAPFAGTGGWTQEPRAVLIGQQSFRTALLPVTVQMEPLATYRLGASADVCQRILHARGAGSGNAGGVLETVALAIYPCAEPVRWLAGAPAVDESLLGFGAARILAAVLRALLPVVFRGAAESVEVALFAAREPDGATAAGEVAEDGLYVFDLAAGGNGTARAIDRDGVELLLRLCRLTLERVLSLDRLRALHDVWGDTAEILAETRRQRSGDPDDPGAEEPRGRDQELRQEALTWLDSRLRPEGGSPMERLGEHGSGAEPGEGDPADLGRCWYTEDGGVTDLLWAKHRWRLPSGREAALDIGFDRQTAVEARSFGSDLDLLSAYATLYQEHLADAGEGLADGCSRGAPRPVLYALAERQQVERSTIDLSAESLQLYHSLACALATHSRPALRPLTTALMDRCGPDADLTDYLKCFVQGIPYSIPQATLHGLRPPVSLLLYRMGDCDTKALLLALLLEEAGIEAGLFISFEEAHALAAVAVPVPAGAGDAATGFEALELWREQRLLPRLPPFWAGLPADPASEVPARLFVPVETTASLPVGAVTVERPETWAFLPLTAIRRRFDAAPERVQISDRAEHETRF